MVLEGTKESKPIASDLGWELAGQCINKGQKYSKKTVPGTLH